MQKETNYDQLAQEVFDKHPKQVAVYESHSLKNKFDQPITPRDIGELGQQISAFESYVKFNENQGSLGSLGQLPLVGVDVITAIYAQSLAPILASIQPMDEEQGIVWHKEVRAGDTRAGLTAEELVRNRLDGNDNKYNSDYVSSTGENRYGESVAGGGIDGTANFTLALTGPVRPQTIAFDIVNDVNGVRLGKFMDDGEGLILGNLGSGTIDYATGAMTFQYTVDGLAVVTALAPTVSVRGSAQTDMELMDKLPSFKPVLANQIVKAEVQAAQIQYGALQQLLMAKRFGIKASDEFASDLTNEMTIAQNTRIVEEFAKGPQGNVDFTKVGPANLGLIEHRMGFSATVGEAEENLIANAGIGGLNNIVCGRGAVVFLRSLPGFKKIQTVTTGNVAVMGSYDGMPVIRAAGVAGVGNDQMIFGFKGIQNIDAPLVVAPVLPLFITDVQGDLDNGLKNSKAAASLVAYKKTAPQYTTAVTLI